MTEHRKKLMRKYVDVIANIHRNGDRELLYIKVENKLYPIHVNSYRETYCESGGSAMRYECTIGKQDRYVFFDGKSYFVEVEALSESGI